MPPAAMRGVRALAARSHRNRDCFNSFSLRRWEYWFRRQRHPFQRSRRSELATCADGLAICSSGSSGGGGSPPLPAWTKSGWEHWPARLWPPRDSRPKSNCRWIGRLQIAYTKAPRGALHSDQGTLRCYRDRASRGGGSGSAKCLLGGDGGTAASCRSAINNSGPCLGRWQAPH